MLRRLALLCLLMFLLYLPMLLLANASSNYIDIYLPALKDNGVIGLLKSIFTGKVQRCSIAI